MPELDNVNPSDNSSLFAKFDEVLILRLFDKAMHCIYFFSHSRLEVFFSISVKSKKYRTFFILIQKLEITVKKLFVSCYRLELQFKIPSILQF